MFCPYPENFGPKFKDDGLIHCVEVISRHPNIQTVAQVLRINVERADPKHIGLSREASGRLDMRKVCLNMLY